MKKFLLFGSAIFFISFCSSCGKRTEEGRKISNMILEVKTKYAPDTRMAIFNVTARQYQKKLIVTGEIENPGVKVELMKLLSGVGMEIIDSVSVLPGKNLGELTKGLVRISVGNIRKDPVHSSELVSQVLLGTVVKIWKRQNGWFYVQSPDQYLGWMEENSLIRCSKEIADGWAVSDRVIVTAIFGQVYRQANSKSIPVSDLVMGCILKSTSRQGAWYKVELPDGRAGFVQNSLVMDFERWKKNVIPTPENIETVAMSLLGIPYLWGGTSTKGMDCSGFTKTVFGMNGIQLQRDANQQATQGREVVPGEHYQNLQKGDLLFFGHPATAETPERIWHVGIFLGDQTFINAAPGMVAITSLDPRSELYDESRMKTFVRVRRLIPLLPGYRRPEYGATRRSSAVSQAVLLRKYGATRRNTVKHGETVLLRKQCHLAVPLRRQYCFASNEKT